MRVIPITHIIKLYGKSACLTTDANKLKQGSKSLKVECSSKTESGSGVGRWQRGGGMRTGYLKDFSKKIFPQKIYKLSTNKICLQYELSSKSRNAGY